jgi:putative ABC transport system ATP-binding protein
MPLIRTTALTKEYQMGSTIVPALRGVSVDIEAGEFVASWAPRARASPPS